MKYNLKMIENGEVKTVKATLLRATVAVSRTAFIGDFETDCGRFISAIADESQEVKL